MALVGISDFEDRLGRALSGTEVARATAALDDASALVLGEGDSTWTDSTVPDVVAAVVLQVARRTFDNPTGVSQKSIDDYSVSYGSVSAGAAYLNRSELRIVRKAGGTNFTAVTLESPYSGDATADLVL